MLLLTFATFATFARRAALAALALPLIGAPALAENAPAETPPESPATRSDAVVLTSAAAPSVEQERPQGPPPGVTGQGPPVGAIGFRPVFDDTWVSLGIGAGLVPSYSGSDDYRLFPFPLIVGRVGGVGFSPNGPGLTLDLLSPQPSLLTRKPQISAGPTFRIRNDRADQVIDDVVEQLEDLDLAVEIGAAAGVSLPGVFNARDTLRLSAQARWDVAGAHDGMIVEPGIGYTLPLNPGLLVQASVGFEFVDDSFAEYYYSVSPAQSAASGLPVFDADGGLNSVGGAVIVTIDLDGNAFNGGFNIYSIAGYSRLVGDAAETPFTAERGSANQFIGGIGVGYTF